MSALWHLFTYANQFGICVSIFNGDSHAYV